jgi:hypothetical protein
MPLLIEVHSDDHDGLVGITEGGKKILLTAPMPQSVSGPAEAEEDHPLERLQAIARQDNAMYYQVASLEEEMNPGTVSLAFNCYEERVVGVGRITNSWFASQENH